jgi:hypothetical protein
MYKLTAEMHMRQGLRMKQQRRDAEETFQQCRDNAMKKTAGARRSNAEIKIDEEKEEKDAAKQRRNINADEIKQTGSGKRTNKSQPETLMGIKILRCFCAGGAAARTFLMSASIRSQRRS